jgi:hypothetical protein
MNERIKQLAEQATSSRIQYDPKTMMTERIQEFDKEKFAELIVLKCADIINHRADTCSDWLDSVKANEAVREGQRECAKTIKEHFGVEE